jgi:uncharacterized protein YndB with AHSA1/START domain
MIDANLPPRPNYIAVAYINAPVERVWKSLTDPADQATFFGGKTEIGEVGDKWIRHATDQWPAITGVVLAKEAPVALSSENATTMESRTPEGRPGRLLVTWGFEGNPPPDRVEFLVESAAGGTTRVTINEYHSRDWPQDITDSAVQGWAALLSGLKTIVETGKPLPSPF